MTKAEFALLDRILAGNQQEYAILVDTYKNFAFTIALKIAQNRPEAEEITQDAFIKAFHNLKNFKRDSKFSTWLYRIVFNTAISYKRKSKVHYSLEQVVVEHRPEGEGVMEHKDRKKFINQALEKINEADRTALILFYLQEHSLEEIADITGIPTNTLKVRLHRARHRLADALKEILHTEALTL